MNELRMPKHQPFEYDLTPETLARWSRAAVCPACYGTGILELLRERLPCTLCSGGGRIGPLAALENAATPSVAPTAAGLRGTEDGGASARFAKAVEIAAEAEIRSLAQCRK